MSAVLGPTCGVPSPNAPPSDARPSDARPSDAASAAAWIRGPGDPIDRREIGGKAAALAALDEAGVAVPRWRVVTPAAHQGSHAEGGRVTASPAVAAAIRATAAALLDAGAGADAEVGAATGAARWLAVRSSAADEDGDAHSFAGQLESYLYVALDDVVARVEDVWASAASARLLAYRRERGLDGPPSVPAVLLQPMVDADVAGVAFSADPVSGRRAHAVIAATYGLGTTIVGGEQDGDTYTVDQAGAVVAQSVARKSVAHRLAPEGGVHEVPVAPEAQERPCLTPAEAAAVAALARAAERHAGRPQDIEWAIAGGRLVLLQARPVTSLAAIADPDGAPAVWDNSNITESYGGVTTPLTYTFARMVYEAVYAQFCRMVAVREAQVAAHAATFHCMIGLVRGRVYYNLTNWYRALALLPGYALNRGFMEQMMGVKEPLPPALADALAASATPSAAGPLPVAARARAVWDVARCAAALLRAYRGLRRDVPAFHARLAAVLAAPAVPLEAMRADELVAHYRDLERRLLLRWDTPLVNDFFAMLLFGTLGRLCQRWVGDADGTLQNDLVSGAGDIVSAKPARLISAMADQVRAVPGLAAVLATGTPAAIRGALHERPDVARSFAAYLDEFGERCLEELKLETLTLADEPLQLYRAVGRLAGAPARLPNAAGVAAPHAAPRALAEARVDAALGRRGPRARLFGWVLREARARVRDRENLRFERTRLFGRVRRVFVELGRRYAAAGLLADPRDVFYLDLDEVLGAVDATVSCDDLAGLAATRRAAFAGYAAGPAPADRFLTHGLVLAGHSYTAPAAVTAAAAAAVAADGDDARRQGIGCYPGEVTGRVRVVRDPRTAELEPGEILVAERTDPGWVMLFPAAAALLVERGSLLSHSAIVARELGLPAVVSVPGLTGWLATGDTVTLDGRTGVVTRVARAADPTPAAA